MREAKWRAIWINIVAIMVDYQIIQTQLDTETQNQSEIITSTEKNLAKAADIAETIPAYQGESNDVDESTQKN